MELIKILLSGERLKMAMLTNSNSQELLEEQITPMIKNGIYTHKDGELYMTYRQRYLYELIYGLNK